MIIFSRRRATTSEMGRGNHTASVSMFQTRMSDDATRIVVVVVVAKKAVLQTWAVIVMDRIRIRVVVEILDTPRE